MRQQVFNHGLMFSYNPQIMGTAQEKAVESCGYCLLTEPSPGMYVLPRKSIKEESIQTEGPLPEKDEVKKAEQRTMEEQKKVEKQQPGKSKK